MKKVRVKDLIQKLSGFDPELIVSVDGYEGGITDNFNLKVESVRLNANPVDWWWYGRHDIKEKGKIKRLVIGRGSR